MKTLADSFVTKFTRLIIISSLYITHVFYYNRQVEYIFVSYGKYKMNKTSIDWNEQFLNRRINVISVIIVKIL